MQKQITEIYKSAAEDKKEISSEQASMVFEVIEQLDRGEIRVYSPETRTVNDWVKKSILLYFRIQKMSLLEAGDFNFFDKIPVKKWSGNEGVRAVPLAIVRKGAFVAPQAVLMPSYVNIGAYVGEGSMIDTWATVGSCAQVGRNVHVSGGVGLGGVLEPVQASPVVIEDNAFLGSRCIIVEGVCVESEAVIGAGVTLTASTPIVDVTQKEPVVYKGRVPARSVVIPGTQMKDFTAGSYGVPCALIIGKRKESTDHKTSLNSVLRDFNVPV